MPTREYVGVYVSTLHICEASIYMRGAYDGILVSYEAHRERHGCVDLRTLHICEAPIYMRGADDGVSVSYEALRQRQSCVDLRTLHICKAPRYTLCAYTFVCWCL